MRNSDQAFTSHSAYLLRFIGRLPDLFAPNIWDIYAPSRCKIFIWLIHKERLRTREFLFTHGRLDCATCPFCPDSENIRHFFLSYHKATSFWESSQVKSTAVFIQDLWPLQQAPWSHLPKKVASTLLTACSALEHLEVKEPKDFWLCWQIHNATPPMLCCWHPSLGTQGQETNSCLSSSLGGWPLVLFYVATL